MFLFIFESFGTSELILIGIVALIVFGPRKLPQIAKTIGKTMADFRKTTSEFKTTWEREANLDEDVSEKKINRYENENYGREIKPIEKPVEQQIKQINSPEIKEISSAEAEKIFAAQNRTPKVLPEEKNENDKRSWL